MVLSNDGTKDGLRWQVKAKYGASPARLQHSQPRDEAKDHDGSSQFDDHARSYPANGHRLIAGGGCRDPEHYRKGSGNPAAPRTQQIAGNFEGLTPLLGICSQQVSGRTASMTSNSASLPGINRRALLRRAGLAGGGLALLAWMARAAGERASSTSLVTGIRFWF